MEQENYNGRTQGVRRVYDSLKNFVGMNRVHKPGDILCISLRNNDRYDLFLMADGASTFIQLLLKYRNGEIAPVGQSSAYSTEDIKAIIRGIIRDEGITPAANSVGTDEIRDGSIRNDDLAQEVKDKMTVIYDSEDEGIRLCGYAKEGDLPSGTTNGSQGNVSADEEESDFNFD